jgi:hypothetical protein
LLAFLLFLLPASAFGQAAMPADYQGVLTALGKQGDFKENVLRINIPRNDVHVVVDGVATPTPFGFGGWLALTKGTGGMDVMMGDLVLTENEVNPVMSALLTNGLDVTALHNHFFFDTPRIYYMHVHGHGNAADLAMKVKPALALIGTGSAGATANGRAITGTLDSAALARIVGYDGEQNGAVYKITIGRPDIPLKEMGAAINSRMGLNTWAAFYGNDGDAVIAGDIANARQRGHSGAQGVAHQWHRRRGHPPPHDWNQSAGHFSSLLGEGSRAEARDRVPFGVGPDRRPTEDDRCTAVIAPTTKGGPSVRLCNRSRARVGRL